MVELELPSQYEYSVCHYNLHNVFFIMDIRIVYLIIH